MMDDNIRIERYGNGQIKTKVYLDYMGNFHGEYKSYFLKNSNNIPYLIQLNNVEYNEIGQLSISSNYINGKLDGEMKKYHPNGELWKIYNFRGDKRHGLSQVFYRNNQLSDSSYYFDGVKVSYEIYINKQRLEILNSI